MADGAILISGDAPPLTSSSPSMHDVDEEGEVCRIYRLPGSTSNPLRCSCACRDSIKYVHEECLFQWLNVDNKSQSQCEVCRHTFSFSLIFAENTPAKLPFYKIVAWGVAKALSFLPFFFCLSCLILVWFVIVPFIIRQVWRLTLMTGILAEHWDALFDYNFTIVDSLIGLLCHMGMNLLVVVFLSLRRNFRQPTNQRPRIEDVFAGEVVVEVVIRIDVPHAALAEAFGMEGSIYFYLKQVFRALGINAALTISLVAFPIYLGRIILYYSTIASSLHALVVGYIPIFGLGFIYLWRGHIEGLVGMILFFLGKHLAGTEPLMIGNVSIGRTILCSLREFLVAMIPVMTFLKIVAFLVLHTSLSILFPDIRDRFPNSDQINTFIEERVGNLSLRLLLSISFDGILVAILILLPARLAAQLVPSVFPLDLTFPNIVSNAHEFVALFLVYIPFVAQHAFDFDFGETIRDLLHHWFSVVGWVIGLSNCSVTNNHGIVWAEIEIATVGDYHSRDTIHSRTSSISFDGELRYILLPQIILMLLLAWTTLLLLNMTILIVLVSIGRAVFNAIPYPEDFNLIWHNDFYIISTGYYIMWKFIVTSKKVAHIFKNHDVVAPEIRKMCTTGVKCLTLFFVWVSFIPLLLGLLLDLVTAPLLVPMDATQVLFWHVEWAIGSLCFNNWLCMESATLQKLRANLLLLEQHGISHFTWSSAISETIFPIISVLLTGLCVPYIFAKGIFSLFGYTQLANSAVHHFAWLGFLLLYVVRICAVKLPAWFARLHNFVKDDCYVVGRRVHDYDG